VQKIVSEIAIEIGMDEHGYFNVTGSTICRKSAEPKPIFFGKWVELMNIYVARVLCMT